MGSPDRAPNGPSSYEQRLKALAHEFLESPLAPEEGYEKWSHKTAFHVSGGGLYGYMGVGSMQVLSESGIEPDLLTGASAGSLVSTLYSVHGKEEIYNTGRFDSMLDVFETDPNRSQYFNSDRLDAKLKDCLGDSTFKDAQQELHIIISDVDHERPVLLNAENYDGPLWKAVRASCSIPGLFKPTFFWKAPNGKYEPAHEQNYYPGSPVFMAVDGAVTSDMPLHKFKRNRPDIQMSFGININPAGHVLKHGMPSRIAAAGIQGLMHASRLGTQMMPEKIRRHIMETSKGPTDIATALRKSMRTFLTGARLEDYGINFDPNRGEFAIVPFAGGIPPLGRISKQQCESLIERGRQSAAEAKAKHPIEKRNMALKTFNGELKTLMGLSMEEIHNLLHGKAA